MNRSRVGMGVDREGPSIYLSFRQGQRSCSLQLTRRGAAAYAACLTAACNGDEDVEMESDLVGQLTVKESQE